MTPPVSTLAKLHALKDSFAFRSSTASRLGLGQLWACLGISPKYWVKSHDLPIDCKGLLLWVVTEIYRPLSWGFKEEKKTCTATGKTGDPNRLDFIQIENGECVVFK
jgi:hypothetical protein